MCESIVYVREGDSERLYARDIATMIFEGGEVVLIDIAGNRYLLTNVVLEYVDFIGHRVFLRKLK
ncbi:MAG: CooT family nickel-binding protein [Sulfolobales archaeon]|nr:CooT family nickel-binding protein [Sulfolobales archaeon]MCX8199379.1 CooT family nickel-binding protein [Sulfolobales archaeon]MDW8170307.1 CooT family nickel-binding protein [Desulfurococcaceae archaeon]